MVIGQQKDKKTAVLEVRVIGISELFKHKGFYYSHFTSTTLLIFQAFSVPSTKAGLFYSKIKKGECFTQRSESIKHFQSRF